jgi:hypothetical protein
MAADLALYYPKEVAEAAEAGDLEQRLRVALRDLRATFADRVPPEIRGRREFVKEALDTMVESKTVEAFLRPIRPVSFPSLMAQRLGTALGRAVHLLSRLPAFLRDVASSRRGAARPKLIGAGPARVAPEAPRPSPVTAATGEAPPEEPAAAEPSADASAAVRLLRESFERLDETKGWVLLTSAMENPSAEVRRAAATLVGRAKVHQAVHSLIVALDDPDLGVRREALRALQLATGLKVDLDPAAGESFRRQKMLELEDWWRLWYLARVTRSGAGSTR